MPHSPTTPAKASRKPTMAFRRQRGSLKQLAERPHLLLFRARLEPLLGLFQLLENDEGQRRGDGAGQELPSPGAGDGARDFHLPDDDAGQRGHHVADRRGRLHHAQRVRPRALRHHFRHQRDAHRELSADAQAAEEAVDVEVPHARAKARSGR